MPDLMAGATGLEPATFGVTGRHFYSHFNGRLYLGNAKTCNSGH
jgi:hypothetical protein